MSPTPPPTREEFDRWVHEALNHIYDSAELEKLPLYDLLIPLEKRSSNRSQDLRRLLINTIQSFKPDRGTPLQSPDWRGYQILEQRFISGLSPNEVIARMNISRSLIFMEQARMLKRLTDTLWENRVQPDSQHAEEQPSNEMLLPVEKSRFVAVALSPLLESMRPVAQSLAHAQQAAFEIDTSATDRSIPLGDRVLLRQVMISLIVELASLVPGGSIRLSSFEQAATYGIHLSGAARAGLAGSPPRAEWGREERQSLSPEDCRNLLHEMGGKLVVSESTDQTFTAKLEWQKENKKHTLLLVDDQADLGDLFRRYLEGSGWEVIQAGGAETARSLLATAAPDLILLDVIMPNEDGWELLVELKGNERYSHIPVYVCSAINEPELIRSLGSAGYLPKPISYTELFQVIKRHS